MNAKKLLALILALVMCIGCFAACAGTEPEPTDNLSETPSSDSDSQPSESTEFSYPMEAGHSLTLWKYLGGNIQANYTTQEDTEIAKWLTEATGIEVDWQDDHANTDESYSLMLSEGNYADLIQHDMSSYPGGTTAALADGVAIPLNDIIEQYCPNLKALLEANPEIDKALKNDDGIYTFFPVIADPNSTFSYASYLRADLLEEMGEKMPTTLEELHDLLVKVKKAYPDMIPWTTDWEGLFSYSVAAYAYGVGNIISSAKGFMRDDDGNVYFARSTENYKEFLQTMNQWYNEGLLEPDVASIAGADVKAKMINGQAFMSNGWLTGSFQAVQQAGHELNEKYQLAAIAPLGVNGKEATDCYTRFLIGGNGVTITKSCKDIEAAARFLDYFYSEEGILLTNYGKEGVSYTMVDGVPTYTEDVLKNYPEGWTLAQSICRYATVPDNGVGVMHPNYYAQTIVEECCKDHLRQCAALKNPLAHALPILSYTAEESDTIGKITTNISTAVAEWSLGFIMGTISFDQWDAYVATLEDMGLQQAVEINAAALARYNAR